MTKIAAEKILRVKEALIKDVGRVIARIDPKDMNLIGLESGDVVLIEGKRSIGLWWPLSPRNRISKRLAD